MSTRTGFWTLQRMVLALALVGGAGVVATNWRDFFPSLGLSAEWAIDSADTYAVTAAIAWTVGRGGGHTDHNEVARHGRWGRTTYGEPGDIVVLEVVPANSRALTRCRITWKGKLIARDPADDYMMDSPYRRGRGASCHAVIPSN